MDKLEKKREKLKERIEFLEMELRESLTKKLNGAGEVNISQAQRTIRALKAELALMNK